VRERENERVADPTESSDTHQRALSHQHTSRALSIATHTHRYASVDDQGRVGWVTLVVLDETVQLVTNRECNLPVNIHRRVVADGEGGVVELDLGSDLAGIEQ